MSEPKGQPDLSVVLPVRNESVHILDVLEQLLRQSLQPERFEILVVDGMSTDDTREKVRGLMEAHPHIRLLDNPAGLSGGGRNVGVRHARAPYVLFVDGHCRIPNPDMLSAVLAAFEGGALCVSRPQPLIADGVDPFQAAASAARTSWLGHHTGSRIYADGDHLCSPLSAGCGYSRALYLEMGGIDESFDAGEDLEFNLRIHKRGIHAHHSHAFEVCYHPRGNALSLFRQLYRYGYGRARMSRKHPSEFSPLSTLLMLFVLWMLLAPLAAPVWGPALHMWASTSAVYGLCVAGLSAWLAVRRHVCFPHVVAAFLASHFGAGLGFFSGLIGGPRWAHAPRPKRESADPA